jgi:hypothetical protein
MNRFPNSVFVIFYFIRMPTSTSSIKKMSLYNLKVIKKINGLTQIDMCIWTYYISRNNQGNFWWLIFWTEWSIHSLPLKKGEREKLDSCDAAQYKMGTALTHGWISMPPPPAPRVGRRKALSAAPDRRDERGTRPAGYLTSGRSRPGGVCTLLLPPLSSSTGFHGSADTCAPVGGGSGVLQRDYNYWLLRLGLGDWLLGGGSTARSNRKRRRYACMVRSLLTRFNSIDAVMAGEGKERDRVWCVYMCR